MTSNFKTLLGAVGFAIALAVAFLVYNNLQQEFDAVDFMVVHRHEYYDNQELSIADDDTINEDTPPEAPQAPQMPLAPDFTMQDAYGNDVQLSDFRGKPVVLNFWATWCPACRVETPYFDAFYNEMGDEVHVLKVVLLDGQRETHATVDAFMEAGGYTFPLFFDATGEGAGAYGVRTIPVTYFINADGYLGAHFQGALNDSVLQAGLEIVS